MAYNSRTEIDEKYLWDLTDMFADDAAFEAALERAQAYPEQIAAYQGSVSESAANLLAFLQLDTQIDLEMSKLVNWSQRKSDEDTRDSKYQAYSSQVMTLCTQLASAGAWFSSEILELSDAQMEQFYADEPGLELYRRSLDQLFRMREHVLSHAEEAILARAGEMASAPEEIFSLLNDADLSFPDAHDAQGNAHPVTHGSYIPLMMSSDRALRMSAFKSVYGTYGQFRNTFAATLAAQAKQLKFYTDVLTEETMDGVPIQGINVPAGKVLRTFPPKVRIHFVAGADRIRSLCPDDFTVITDYNEIMDTHSEKCKLYLRSVPQGISRASLETKEVDYLIEEE